MIEVSDLLLAAALLVAAGFFGSVGERLLAHLIDRFNRLRSRG